VPAAAKLATEVGRWTSQKEQAWEIHPEPLPTPEKPDEVVLFMSGWYWRTKFFSRTVDPKDQPEKQSKFLDAGDARGNMEFQFSPNETTLETVKLSPEKFGDYKFEA
jgi:hypothetical protein